MADAILYEDYLMSLLSRVDYSHDQVVDSENTITYEKKALLGKNDILLDRLNRSLNEADALMDKAERIRSTAEAKANEARQAIQPLPPQPSPPTDEQKKQNPGCDAVYQQKCMEYEELRQRNEMNAARAEEMTQSADEVRQFMGWLADKRNLLLQLLSDAQNAREEFPNDLTYLAKTKDRLEAFRQAMDASRKAADDVLSCTCDRSYNSFLKFDMPLPFDTAKIGYRFRVGNRFPSITGRPSFLDYAEPTPVTDFSKYDQTKRNNVGKKADDATEITVIASTVDDFLSRVNQHPKARIVYSTRFCIRYCGKNALIKAMEAKGFHFTDDPDRPKFEK